jgi:hypothetical protein
VSWITLTGHTKIRQSQPFPHSPATLLRTRYSVTRRARNDSAEMIVILLRDNNFSSLQIRQCPSNFVGANLALPPAR